MEKAPAQIIEGEIWQVTENPFFSADPETVFDSRTNAALAVDENGVIVDTGPARDIRKKYPDAVRHNYGDCLLLPGFVDTHLHYPQMDIIGSYGEQLIGWLNKYTFPAEAANSDFRKAGNRAERFITELVANGTTTASIFSSSHRGATKLLFEEADRRGCRAIIGKVSMDRNAPEEICIPPEQDMIDSEFLIETWHGYEGRLFYALSPRFVPTCSDELLAGIGELKQKYPDLYLQTHHSENPGEVEWVKKLCPNERDYLSVYDRHGLLSEKTILGHSIHLTDEEQARIAETKTAIAHCPTANLFLGSGLFKMHEIIDDGIRVGLGTDIGGGTSFSLWQTMLEAYKIQQLRGQPLSPAHLFYLATLGGAKVLSLDQQIGNFAVGKKADIQVINWRNSRLLKARFEETQSAIERLFALITLGDDRLVANVFINGQVVF